MSSEQRILMEKSRKSLLNISKVNISAHYDLNQNSNGLIKEILFFSNGSHLEWMVWLSDIPGPLTWTETISGPSKTHLA